MYVSCHRFHESLQSYTVESSVVYTSLPQLIRVATSEDKIEFFRVPCQQSSGGKNTNAIGLVPSKADMNFHRSPFSKRVTKPHDISFLGINVTGWAWILVNYPRKRSHSVIVKMDFPFALDVSTERIVLTNYGGVLIRHSPPYAIGAKTVNSKC